MKKPSEDNILSHQNELPESEAIEGGAEELEAGSDFEEAAQTEPGDAGAKSNAAEELSGYKFMKPVSVKHSSHSSRSGSGHHHHHGHRKRRRKKMKTWKKVLIIVMSVLLAIVIAVTTVVLILVNQGYTELFDVQLDVKVPATVQAEVQDSGDYISYNGAMYQYNHDITSLLFMGVDKRSIEGENEQGTGGQADLVVLIAINVKDHKMSMIAVPRDTIAEVAKYTPNGHYNGMANMQICLAYAYGDGKESSCDNMVSSVRKVFYNIPIKTYYALDLDGIAAMNDAVGGVDVVSPETIGDFVEGGEYHLEGKEAESFVRDRDKSNVNSSMLRLERQKVYARSYLNKVQSKLKSNPTSAVSMFNDSAPYSCTNLNAAKVAYLAKEFMFGGGMKTDIVSVPGEMSYDGSHAAYTIDEKQFFEQFLSVYYERV